MNVRPTRVGPLLAVAVVSTAVVWSAFRVLDAGASILPALPPTVPLVLAALTVTVLMLASNLRRRLRGGNPALKPVDPLGAARLLAVAKASAYAGAVLAGAYAAVAIYLVPRLAVRPLSLLAVPALSALLAGLLCVAGLVLQRVCRVEPPDDEQPLPGA